MLEDLADDVEIVIKTDGTAILYRHDRQISRRCANFVEALKLATSQPPEKPPLH